jgi:cyclophilin family peptidyl-prolyl cis-trans isomerase
MIILSRMRLRLGEARFLVLGVLAIVSASGCGTMPAARDQIPGAPVVGGTPAGRLGACWGEDQRVKGGTDMKQYAQAPATRIEPGKRYTGAMQTNKGTIEFELYPQDAPNTVNNFVCLAQDGYFDRTPFHRIVKGFVIQGGDPTGSGMGGPGYKFADEPVAKDYERGTLAMANAGPNTNGSQFFIVLDDLRGKLPKNYTIFGKVTDGLDVVDLIADTPTVMSAGGEKSKPAEPITLESVSIEES